MRRLLVDSSIWIRTSSLRFGGPFREYLVEARRSNEVAVTGMVRVEVMIGAPSWEDLIVIQEDFDSLTQFEPTSDTWSEAGRMGMRLRKRGLTVQAPDLLIAAVAIEHGLTIAHADRDFELIAKHEKLKTESLLHLTR